MKHSKAVARVCNTGLGVVTTLCGLGPSVVGGAVAAGVVVVWEGGVGAAAGFRFRLVALAAYGEKEVVVPLTVGGFESQFTAVVASNPGG